MFKESVKRKEKITENSCKFSLTDESSSKAVREALDVFLNKEISNRIFYIDNEMEMEPSSTVETEGKKTPNHNPNPNPNKFTYLLSVNNNI